VIVPNVVFRVEERMLVNEHSVLLSDPTADLLDALQLRCFATHEVALFPDHSFQGEGLTPGFLFVSEGCCEVRFEEEPPLSLQMGQLLLFPHGLPFAATAAAWPSPGTGDLPKPGQSPRPRLVLGRVRYTSQGLSPLLAGLPKRLVIQDQEGTDQFLKQVLDLTCTEIRHDQRGGIAIINLLLSVACVQELRRWLEAHPATEPGWLAGIHDGEIGPILSLMLRQPEQDWTIQSLAEAGQMARSTFARRFRRLVGEAPMDVLTGIRMRAACQMLQGDHGLKEVARSVGYRSVSAFSVAFRRWSGGSPVAYRASLEAESADSRS